MIPDLTATVRAALDQRLSVARPLAVDALAPVSGDADARRPDTSTSAPPLLPLARGDAALAFAARWPVGSTIAARIVATLADGRLVADVDGLPLELQWRGGDGAVPTMGETLAFRVLAQRPEVVLQRLATPAAADLAGGDTPTRISHDAQALQAAATLAAHGADDDRTIRFTTPLVADATAASDDGRAASRSGFESLVRAAGDATQSFAPVLLSGPAWQAQPMELVVRRQRRDETVDDPTEDDWCGELVIDLPHLGRVAGHLAWSIHGLRVRLDADRASGATTLADAAPELAAAFVDMRLRIAGLSIGQSLHGSRDG